MYLYHFPYSHNIAVTYWYVLYVTTFIPTATVLSSDEVCQRLALEIHHLLINTPGSSQPDKLTLLTRGIPGSLIS